MKKTVALLTALMLVPSVTLASSTRPGAFNHKTLNAKKELRINDIIILFISSNNKVLKKHILMLI